MNKILYMIPAFLFTLSSELAAQEQIPPPPRDQGIWQTVIIIGIALAFFYFILWRPEQKRRREMEKQRDTLKKGDRVTAMGIIGKVSKVKEHTVILEMHDGSKIEFLKAAITDVMNKENEENEVEEIQEP
ncbi:MAG: preprotein translocase subunit YajC [Chlamydiales bacterium]